MVAVLMSTYNAISTKAVGVPPPPSVIRCHPASTQITRNLSGLISFGAGEITPKLSLESPMSRTIGNELQEKTCNPLYFLVGRHGIEPWTY